MDTNERGGEERGEIRRRIYEGSEKGLRGYIPCPGVVVLPVPTTSVDNEEEEVAADSREGATVIVRYGCNDRACVI